MNLAALCVAGAHEAGAWERGKNSIAAGWWELIAGNARGKEMWPKQSFGSTCVPKLEFEEREESGDLLFGQ